MSFSYAKLLKKQKKRVKVNAGVDDDPLPEKEEKLPDAPKKKRVKQQVEGLFDAYLHECDNVFRREDHLHL